MIDSLLEKNLLPDWLIRVGIRRLLRQRLRGSARAALAEQSWSHVVGRFETDLAGVVAQSRPA
jgi:hypothetical protein